MDQEQHKSPSRRHLLQCSVAGATIPLLRPERVIGANQRLNLGAFGVGGSGAGDLATVAGENIVAICDVDQHRLDAAAAKHPRAQKYADYRKLLEQRDLDGVVIATPDHHHPPATMRALRRGLHVYCEAMKITNIARANDLLSKPYRRGWEIESD